MVSFWPLDGYWALVCRPVLYLQFPAGQPITWLRVNYALFDWYVFAVLSVAGGGFSRRFRSTRHVAVQRSVAPGRERNLFASRLCLLRAWVAQIQGWSATSPPGSKRCSSCSCSSRFNSTSWFTGSFSRWATPSIITAKLRIANYALPNWSATWPRPGCRPCKCSSIRISCSIPSTPSPRSCTKMWRRQIG